MLEMRYSSMAKSVPVEHAFNHFYLPSDKTESHIQAGSEVRCSKGLADYLKGGNTGFGNNYCNAFVKSKIRTLVKNLFSDAF